MIEDLLRRADLLNEAIAHYDDPVAKRHRLNLVMGDIDECRIDFLTEFDKLGAHLVTELSVKVGKGFVHQEDLGMAHDRSANGYALALSARKSLRFSVKILGNVKNLGGFAYNAINLCLRILLEL